MGSRTVKFFALFEKWAVLIILMAVAVWGVGFMQEMQERRFEESHAAETFMTVERINIGNAVIGQTVPMDVSREIKRPFHGTYTVEIRYFPARTVVCAAHDSLHYVPDANYPNPLDLDWWSNDGECGVDTFLTYGPGEYIATTTWTIHRDEYGLDDVRVGPIESNVFTIQPIDPQEAGQAVMEQRALQSRIERLENEIQELKGAD